VSGIRASKAEDPGKEAERCFLVDGHDAEKMIFMGIA
jgi:hypothetical protein